MKRLRNLVVEILKMIDNGEFEDIHNEELIVQSVISSEEPGYALLRALQLVTNTFGADTIIKIVDKLEKNPKLADKAIKTIPMLLMI